jgi:hypothetical protein
MEAERDGTAAKIEQPAERVRATESCCERESER